MGIFTDAREKKVKAVNAARQRVVEDFLSERYFEGKSSQDLMTRVTTETAEDYVIRQEGYRAVIEALREKTSAWRDDYYSRYDEFGEALYLVTARLLDQEYAYLDFCLRIVEENILRAEDASFYANRLGRLTHRVRRDWLDQYSRQHSDLPKEARDFINKLS
ncbi:MAG: hypothetical protein ABW161_01150 [Candidatus Thiodiazotropha sp.]